MRTTTVRNAQWIVAVALLALPLVAQKTPPKLNKVSSKIAGDLSRSFGKLYASKDPKERLAAVESISAYAHSTLARCLGKALRDGDDGVRCAAARALGKQEPKSAARYLKSAFLDRGNQSRRRVLVAVLQGYQGISQAPPLKNLVNDFEERPKEVQREIVKTARWSRSKKTVAWLAQHYESPRPGNVDSPTNPPASYWKKRVEAWSFWGDEVAASLLHLTAVEFEDTAAIKAWVRSPAKIKPLKKSKR